MNAWKLTGKITLYTLIVFGLLALGVFAWAKMWYWFAVIGGCFACVLIGEGVSYLKYGHSISKQYGHWFKRDALKASLGLVFFSLAMISLVLHLVAYGLR